MNQGIAATCAWLLAAGAAVADNWPQFRGPGTQGVSGDRHLPQRWSASDNVAWRTAIPGESWSSPVVWGVFTAGGWGGKETIKKFRLGGRGDLKETNLVWEQKKGMPKVPSMVFVKPYLFAITDGGVATCVDARTGELIWQERVGGSFSASPLAAGGLIYLVDDEGETTVIEASARFKVLAKNPLGEKVQASMAAAAGRLFIRTEQALFGIGR